MFSTVFSADRGGPEQVRFDPRGKEEAQDSARATKVSRVIKNDADISDYLIGLVIFLSI